MNKPSIAGICAGIAVFIFLAFLMPRTSCSDGWHSFSIGRQGACSHHGGVNDHSGLWILAFAVSVGAGMWLSATIKGSKKNKMIGKTEDSSKESRLMSVDLQKGIERAVWFIPFLIGIGLTIYTYENTFGLWVDGAGYVNFVTIIYIASIFYLISIVMLLVAYLSVSFLMQGFIASEKRPQKLLINKNPIILGILISSLIGLSGFFLARHLSSERTEKKAAAVKVIKTKEQSKKRPPKPIKIKIVSKWHDLENWRQLRIGLSKNEVTAILGEPSSIRRDTSSEYWSYGGDYKAGEVSFQKSIEEISNGINVEEKLREWKEPDTSLTFRQKPISNKKGRLIFMQKGGTSLNDTYELIRSSKISSELKEYTVKDNHSKKVVAFECDGEITSTVLDDIFKQVE